MDLFSLLFFRLDSYLLLIRKLYSYIFRFFLPDAPEGDDSDDEVETTRRNKVSI